MKILSATQYAYALNAGLFPDTLETDATEGIRWVKSHLDLICVLKVYPKYATMICTNPRLKEMINSILALANLVKSSSYCAEQLLSGEDNLRHLIRDGYALGDIIQAAPQVAERLLFGEEGNLRYLITHDYTLSKIIEATPPLAERLLFGEEGNLCYLIIHDYKFVKIIQAAPQLAARLVFTEEGNLRVPITCDYELATIIRAAPQLAERLLFDDSNLRHLITYGSEPGSDLAAIIQARPDLAERLLFGEGNLRHLITDGYALGRTIQATPQFAERLLFGESNLHILITYTSYLINIIKTTPQLAERLLFGEGNLRHLITTGLNPSTNLENIIEAAPHLADRLLLGIEMTPFILSAPQAVHDVLLQRGEPSSIGASTGAGAGSRVDDDSTSAVGTTDRRALMATLTKDEDFTHLLTAHASEGADARATFEAHEFLYMLQSPLAIMQYLAVCAQFSTGPLAEISSVLTQLKAAQPALARGMLDKLINIDIAMLRSPYQQFAHAICMKITIEKTMHKEGIKLAEMQRLFVQAVTQLKSLHVESPAVGTAIARALFELQLVKDMLRIDEELITEDDVADAFSDELSRFQTLQKKSIAPRTAPGADTLAGAGFFVDPAKTAREEQARQQAAHDKEFGMVVYEPPFSSSLKK